ncbi:hypothetical protein HYPSUDRAFT_101519, partial [Hypholoma sublateritium FD-334 SS-4]
ISLAATQIPRGTFAAMQRTAAQVKNVVRTVPRPVVINVSINNQPARALLDSGSLGDFISATLTDQLKLTRKTLETPIALQLAVQGSRSKINCSTQAQLKYEGITEQRYFDIINISQYDLILGSPFMFQHSVCVGFNPARVMVGSDTSLPLEGKAVTAISSRNVTMEGASVAAARAALIRYAEPLCKTASETGLPPLRAINHTIPLIDLNKTYRWRPARCPEAFRKEWAEKRNAYLQTGRWRVTSSQNTVPMLLIPKP